MPSKKEIFEEITRQKISNASVKNLMLNDNSPERSKSPKPSEASVIETKDTSMQPNNARKSTKFARYELRTEFDGELDTRIRRYLFEKRRKTNDFLTEAIEKYLNSVNYE